LKVTRGHFYLNTEPTNIHYHVKLHQSLPSNIRVISNFYQKIYDNSSQGQRPRSQKSNRFRVHHNTLYC